ncbi:filamentous hemagglutinin N-terminal domain-containing protein [Sphingomonas sp. NBWT7]|uniref:filamentous hemagglutinin N-terminal domain-containing protein n=1 Tax=Sphingomonas sp. NBWT7 TaxID=2596913 RepID=UPI001623E35D|nr:filamentous hemagglutinin N-terminal domain-containing protein [Sphingomonas sp. NBWT7]QNE32471.1 filamentous hemagglutinin N-terminal domain-containing protein [Sphingomonas sp. NBWT7]
MFAFLIQAPRPRHLRRSVLALTTALGGFGALSAQGQAVRLPTEGDIRGVTTSPLGSDPQLSNPTADQLRVNLRAASTVINWDGFNIPEDKTIAFTNGRVVPGGAAVLNRDVSATSVSQLLGRLTSERDVAVWVHNPNGILVGSKASFATGSLVLTTLDISSTDFVLANDRFRLRAPAGKEASGIIVQDGAKFAINGDTRGLVMIAPKIDARGEFIAQGQDVAFVSAADVTLDYRAGSPLSVTINRGTAVSGTSQYVQGKVAGNNALFALASEGTLTDSLLGVSAEVTTASAGSRGIVLSAGRPTAAVDGLTIAADAAATGGLADVSVSGLLRTQGSSSDVVIAANRAIKSAATIETRSDALLGAGGLLTISGGIGAGDDVRLAGTGIALSGGTGLTIGASDQLQLSTTDGNITGTGTITLRSGSSANDGLLIETLGTALGDILLGGDAALFAGEQRSGGLTLRLRSGANQVLIGTVEARALRSGIGTGAVGNGLRITGAVTTGGVNLREALLIEGATITGGVLASDRGVDLQSTGTIDVAELNARGGSATASAAGAITATGLVRAAGSGSDIRIETPGDVTLAALSAARDIVIGDAVAASRATVAGAVTAGRTYQIDAGAISLGNGTDVSQSAGGAVRLTAGRGGITGLDGLTLGADAAGGDAGMTLAIDAARAAGAGGAIDFAPGTVLLGGTDRQSDISVRSADTTGIVRLGEVRARGLLGAIGTADFTTGITRTVAITTGDVSLRGDLSLTGANVTTGGLTSSAGDVRVVATVGALATGAIDADDDIALTGAAAVSSGGLDAGGLILADAVNALTLGGDVSGGEAVTLRGASVALGTAEVSSARIIDILARSGGIAGGAAITSSSTQAGDYIRLQAAGPEGIVLARDATITGGTNRALGVRIFAAAQAPLVLGDVTARSLGTLATLDGDPLGAAGAFRSQGSLAFGRLNLVQGFTAESIGGDLSVQRITVTGAGEGIDLRATAGTLGVQADLNASGGITLASGAALLLGTVESRDDAVSITTGGRLTATSLAGAAGVGASAASMAVGEVRGGTGAIELTANTGDLSLGAVSGRAVTLQAVNGAIGTTGVVRADGGAVDVLAGGAITAEDAVSALGGGVRLRARDGALSVTGAIVADQAVTLTGASATLAGVESRAADISIRSAGAVQAGAVTAAAGIDTSASALDLGAVLGGSGAVTLSASGGDLTLGGGASGQSLTLRAGGGAITATGAFVATAGAIDGEAAGTLSVGGATATGGTLRLQSGGALAVNGGSAASGDVSLSGSAATLGGVGSTTGNVTITSAGAVRAGDLTGATGVNATGASLAVGNVQGGTGAATLVTTGGDLTLGGAAGSAVTLQAAGGLLNAAGALTASSGAVDVRASNAIGVAGTINAGSAGATLSSNGGAVVAAGSLASAGDATITGTSVTLGGEQRAQGAYTATASAGGVSQTGGALSIRSDSDAAGAEALTLTANGGAIDLVGVPLAGGAVVLRTDGAGISVGAVDAAQLTASGATASGASIRTGALTLGTDLTLEAAGTIETGAISIADGSVSIGSSAGDVSTQAIDTTRGVTLTGNAVSFSTVDAAALSATARMGAITGGDVTVRNAASLKADAGAVTLGRVTSTGGNVAVTAGGALFATAVDAGGSVVITGTARDSDVAIAEGVVAEGAATVRSGRDIRTPFIRSRTSDLTVAAPNGRVSGFAPGSGIDLAAGPGGAFSLTVGTDALLGDVSGGNIAITATSITANSVAGGTQSVSLIATAGDLRVNGPVVGGDVTLTSVIDTTLRTVDASGTLIVGGGRSLSFDTLSGASITATGGAITGTALRTPGAADLRATTITLNRIETGGPLAATAADALVIGTVEAAGVGTLVSGGTATLGTITGDAALTLDVAGALSFGEIAGGAVTLTGGVVDGGSLRAAGAADLRAASLTLDTIETRGALSARTTGALFVDVITSGSGATLSSGAATLGTVSAAGALAIDSVGDLSFDQLSAGSINASAANGVVRGASVRSGGAATLRGATVDLAAAQATGTLLAEATRGAISIGTITAGGDVTVRAAGAATIAGSVTAGGNYRVTAGTTTLGGNGIVQQARGDVRLTTTGDALRGVTGLRLSAGSGPIVLDSNTSIEFAGTSVQVPTGALALRAGSGQSIRLGAIEAGSIGGFDGQAPTDRLTHDGTVEAGTITAGRVALTLTNGDLTTGALTSTGAVSLTTSAGAIRLGEIRAGSLDAKAATALTLGAATVAGAATLEGGSIALPTVTAQSLAVRTAGALTGAGDGRAALRTTGGDLTVDAAAARLGDVSSGGAATLRGGTIDVAGRLAAARQLLADARAALTLGDASAGADLTLKSAAGVTASAVDAAGVLAIDSGADAAINTARSGGALRVTSGGALTLGSGTAGAGIALDANGLARLGALSGGPSVTVRAPDAELTGAVRATSVRFATRDPASTALRIGDGTAADGFRLSAAEVGQIGAETLAFDAGSGALQLGTLALTPGIARSVAMLSTGDVRVTGQLSSSGGAQAIRLGGDGADGAAQTIHVVATSDAGGRLLVDNADLELRGNRIAVGLAPGFIDTLQPGEPGRAQAQALIGNANSALYNPQLGGGFYNPDATTTVGAQSLTVRFGDYALFQNTAIPGQASGATIGSVGAGGGAGTGAVQTALRVSTFGPPQSASFAFFGTINGISGASTALLANPVIDIDALLLPNSRINGCLARSGAGCLTTIVIQPTLQVFDWNTSAVFGIQQDVALPFTPIISGNNEELLSGLPALAPEQPAGAGPRPTDAPQEQQP